MVSCKYCKHYHPAGQVEYGDYSACKIDNRRYAKNVLLSNRIDPMMDEAGKNHNRDCNDFKEIGWWGKFWRNFHYSLVCGFSDRPYTPEELSSMADHVRAGGQLKDIL